MRTINFTPKAFEEYNYWRSADRKMQDKIVELIEDILRNSLSIADVDITSIYYKFNFYNL